MSSIREHDRQTAENYEIQKFSPQELLVRDGVMSIIASTGAGKTVFIKDCLSQIHKDFVHVIVISKTAKLQKCYDFIDRAMIHDIFDEEFLLDLWNKHVNNKLLGKANERTLIIFDDVLNDRKVRNSAVFDDYFTGSRHLGISLWLLSHNYTSLKPLQRNNTCWFVSFDLDSYKERENFASQYLGAENTQVGMALFRRIVREKPYQCIVVVNHKNGTDTTEKVKKYIANPDPPKFKIKNTVPVSKAVALSNEMGINSKPRNNR